MATLFLLVIYFAFISLGLPDSILGASWPVMHVDIGAPLNAAGFVAIAVSGGTVISALFSERLIRRFGTGKVTAFSVFLTATALLAASFSTSVWFLLIAAIPLGLGAGAVDSGLNNYVALHYKPRHMSWLHAFWGVGAFTGPLIMGAFLARNGAWQGGYRTVGIIQFVVCALLFISLPLWKRNSFPTNAPAQDNKPAEALPAITPASQVIRMPGVKSAMATFIFYCATEYTVGIWGSSYLVAARNFTEPMAASAVAAFYIGITAGRFVSGILTIRFSGPNLIRMGIAFLFAGAVLLILPLPNFVAIAALLLMGLGCAPIYPSMIHETPRRFGENNSQKVISWQMASAFCGSTFMPPIVGAVTSWFGMWIMPIFLLGYAVLMLLLTERINRACKKNMLL